MNEAKKKAEELVERFRGEIDQSDFHVPEFFSGIPLDSDEYEDVYNLERDLLAKQCALICVDEIIEGIKQSHLDDSIPYWQQVKQEINNLTK